MQSSKQSKLTELISLFNHLFDKQNLRKNVYLFNATSHNMTISLRTIQKQRKVAAITNDISIINSALKKCSFVQMINDNTIKILMKGDELIVKLRSSEEKNITKKQINHLTRQMRCESKQEKNIWVLQFQSHAAAVEFISRVKIQEKGYLTQLISNDPYEFLSKSIGNLRKDKKIQRTYNAVQELYNSSYYNYNYLNYIPQYAPFVRKAVDSDDEEEKPLQQKQDDFIQQDFPSFTEVQEVIKETK